MFIGNVCKVQSTYFATGCWKLRLCKRPVWKCVRWRRSVPFLGDDYPTYHSCCTFARAFASSCPRPRQQAPALASSTCGPLRLRAPFHFFRYYLSSYAVCSIGFGTKLSNNTRCFSPIKCCNKMFDVMTKGGEFQQPAPGAVPRKCRHRLSVSAVKSWLKNEKKSCEFVKQPPSFLRSIRRRSLRPKSSSKQHAVVKKRNSGM